MLVAVIGAGRIGSAIADAMRSVGHSVQALGSDSGPDPIGSMDPDLIVLAAAPENEAKYADFGEFQTALAGLRSEGPGHAPLASVSFLTPDQLRSVAGDRPAVRFMCSSAVGEGGLRFFDSSGDDDAIDRLQMALPGDWRSVGPSSYERYTRLLIVSALHCAFLDEIDEIVDLDDDEQAFLAETLTEARRMIRAHDGSVPAALDSARTPGGITDALVREEAFAPVAKRLFNL